MRTVYVLSRLVVVDNSLYGEGTHTESCVVGVTTDPLKMEAHEAQGVEFGSTAYELPEDETLPITELANAIRDLNKTASEMTSLTGRLPENAHPVELQNYGPPRTSFGDHLRAAFRRSRARP